MNAELKELIEANAVLNNLRIIQADFCKKHPKCVGCRIGKDLCVEYEIRRAARLFGNLYEVEMDKALKGNGK